MGKTIDENVLSEDGALKLWQQIVSLFAAKSSVTTLQSYFDADGAANKAVQLKSSRNIWGQSFNGTAAISGDMSGVGNIAFGSGTDTKNIGSLIYFDRANSRIGIGTSSPDSKLHVSGTFKATGNSVLGGTLSVADQVSGSKNIQAEWGVAAGGIATMVINPQQISNNYTYSEGSDYVTAQNYTLLGSSKPQYRYEYTERTTLNLNYPASDAVGVMHHLLLQNVGSSSLAVSFPASTTFRRSQTLTIAAGKAVDITYFNTGVELVQGILHVVNWSEPLEVY